MPSNYERAFEARPEVYVVDDATPTGDADLQPPRDRGLSEPDLRESLVVGRPIADG